LPLNLSGGCILALYLSQGTVFLLNRFIRGLFNVSDKNYSVNLLNKNLSGSNFYDFCQGKGTAIHQNSLLSKNQF